MERNTGGSGSVQAAISDAAVHLLREYTGRGPTKARTVISGDLVTILLGDTLTKGETRLVEAGKPDRVLDLRHDFQKVMRDDLVHAVEKEVGRDVIAFMSANHIDPDYGVEVFVLRPDEPEA